MTLRWVPGWNGLTEPEAVSYVAAVEAADNQELEFGVARAINDFVVGCKNDGIWDAIKACCILAGARTLSGALVPLVGTAPTNPGNVFVEADYNRVTGLKGDGSTKYLDSNRAGNAQSGSNLHFSTYATTSIGNNSYTIGLTKSSAPIGVNGVYVFNPLSYIYGNSPAGSAAYTSQLAITGAGFYGASRSNGTTFSASHAGTLQTETISAGTMPAESFYLFADNLVGTGARNYTNARLAFYSIGESLDLEKLDTRVTRLMNLITYTQTAGLPDLATMDLDAAAYIGGGYRAGGTLS